LDPRGEELAHLRENVAEVRAAGFSIDGLSFVFATSADITLFRRGDARALTR
jgi:hypothetical protein